MTNLSRTSPFRDALEELAKSRGLSGAEELARRVAELDPKYTPEMILEAAYSGFGPALNAALVEAGAPLDADEQERLMEALGLEFRKAAKERVEALRRTAFGRVLCELAEEHGISATLEDIGELVERSGLNRWEILDRMSGADMEYQEPNLKGLVGELGLNPEEVRRLARALALEED